MTNYTLIDGNSIGYACQNAAKLHTGEQETQAIFGFLHSVREFIGSHPLNKPVIFWDSVAQWRYDLFPEYKGNRDTEQTKEMREAYHSQKPYIQAALFNLAIPQMTADGYEADDLAGWFSQRASKNNDSVLLVTGDMDWLQLVNKNVSWNDPIRLRKVDDSNFGTFTGYTNGRQFLESKALQGDSSDTIPGVGGIGKKGAQDFLLKYGSVEEFLRLAEQGKLPEKMPKAHQAFAANDFPKPSKAKNPPPSMRMQDRFGLNMKLMNLIDMKAPKKSEISLRRNCSVDVEAFGLLCEELAFTSITSSLDEWLKPFIDLSNK